MGSRFSSQDGQGAGAGNAADGPRPRRRGDRMRPPQRAYFIKMLTAMAAIPTMKPEITPHIVQLI
jgi:hypothetical protein